MPSEKNIQQVELLKEKIAKAKSIVFAQYQGLDANQNNELRRKVKEAGGEMFVTRNTLMKIALNEEGIKNEEAEEKMQGQLAVFFGFEDAIAPIKVVAEFAEEFKTPEFKMGFVNGNFTLEKGLETLSKLPSKEALLTKIVVGLKSPITGITNILGANQRNLVQVLSAIADKQEE